MENVRAISFLGPTAWGFKPVRNSLFYLRQVAKRIPIWFPSNRRKGARKAYVSAVPTKGPVGEKVPNNSAAER